MAAPADSEIKPRSRWALPLAAAACVLTFFGVIVAASVTSSRKQQRSDVKVAKDMMSFLPPSLYGSKIEVHLVGETLVFDDADCEATAQSLIIETSNGDRTVVPMQQVRFYTVKMPRDVARSAPPSGQPAPVDDLVPLQKR